MRITKVHVRKLVSGPGYNNHAVEAEAEVQEGDTPETVVEELGFWVDSQIKRARQAGEMRESLADLAYEVGQLENKKRHIIEEIEELENKRKQLRLLRNTDPEAKQPDEEPMF